MSESVATAVSVEPLRANRCGVALFTLDPWSTLDRFLILGVIGGTYYASERELRVEHLRNLLDLLDRDGGRTIQRILEISQSGRAPRNAPAVAALALAASVGLRMPKTGHYVSADRTGDTPQRAATRRAALAVLPQVCRIPTDLFAFVSWIRRLRGFGPGVSKAIARWYLDAPIDRLILHAIKYEERKGVSHADLLRLSHPRIDRSDSERLALTQWMLAGGIAAGLEKRLQAAAEGVQGNTTPSASLKQLEGAEDLLLVNRWGAVKAAAQAAQKAARRRETQAERQRLTSLANIFATDSRIARRPMANDESRVLFGVPNHLIEAASVMEDEANAYLPGGEEESRHRFDEKDNGYGMVRPRHAPEQDNLPKPEPSLFEPEAVRDAVDILERCSLPHEVVPSHLKREKAVWKALLADMPMQAMIRNLSVMTRVGLLYPGSAAAAYVCGQLRNPVLIRKARIHPMLLLQAAESYRTGRSRDVGRRGCRASRGRAWLPVPEILAALDDAFKLAFINVEPSNVRLMLGVDVSASMDVAFIGDSWLSARSASAAMCMITALTESSWQAVGFTSSCDDWSFDDHEPLRAEVYPGLTRLPISRDISVDEAARRIRELPMGSTDCALPIRYALEHGIEIDAFCIYTDNEHNSGEWTPAEALERYRAATGIPARLICVGMTATDYTIADPRDPLCLNVVGFDAAAPRIIADFCAGRL